VTTPVTATVAVRATTTVAAGAGDTAVSDVAEETHALVRAGHCAQVGDNLVDQVREPVGTAERTRDELWLTVATMSGVPNELPVDARVVHTRRPAETAVDLRKPVVSTESTGLMTTSLRYGSEMTQDVRRHSAADRRRLSDSQQVGGHA